VVLLGVVAVLLGVAVHPVVVVLLLWVVLALPLLQVVLLLLLWEVLLEALSVPVGTPRAPLRLVELVSVA
jgi:hypothetical protein